MREVVFPYGAVYFRKSNPPREDWERDYAQAARDGMNTFRHWFMWSAIEVAPGVFDWSDYDQQLDLAGKYGIQTIIAEHVTFAPEWAFRKFAGCELRSRDGRAAVSRVNVSSAVGGFPGLCLDHSEVRVAAEQFLRTLVERYRDHPGLGGYDLWNECNLPSSYCYCEATVGEFRRWLERRYGSLGDVARAWRRYSVADWEDVHPPADSMGYPEMLDWIRFRADHAYEDLSWRSKLVREVDPGHKVTAHGIAGSLTSLAENAADDWRAAAEVDSYGFTWVVARKGAEAWRQWHAVDLVRAAAKGKPFWHAEMQGGPLWLQPQVIGRPRDDGRIASPEDVRLWNLVSMAGGARGIQYLRWRPLLDGPLFDAFGPYGADGLPTDRSAQVAEIAQWANDSVREALWAAKPVQGELGIVVVPDCQLMTYIQHGDSAPYARAVCGAYKGFFDVNVQADFVHLDDISAYDVVYLPVPLMLGREAAERLSDWVSAGGTLIAEGCVGFFADGGRMCPEQPGCGLGRVFGVRSSSAEFTPDLLERGEDRFVMGGEEVCCGLVKQRYELAGGRALGHFGDGTIAVVDNHFGSGRTLIVGTSVGESYYREAVAGARGWFKALLAWAGVKPHVAVSEPGVVARVQRSRDKTYLWLTNASKSPRWAGVHINERLGRFSEGTPHWGGTATVKIVDGDLGVVVNGRDALVLELQ